MHLLDKIVTINEGEFIIMPRGGGTQTRSK